MTGKRSVSPSGRGDKLPRPTPRLVLLDTNALLLPFRSRFPLLPEIARWIPTGRVVVPDSVLRELDRLVDRDVLGARAARVFAGRFPVVRAAHRGDLGLLELAADRRAWVVTADRALRSRLMAAGVVVLSPRGSVRLARSEARNPATSRRTRSAHRPAAGNG